MKDIEVAVTCRGDAAGFLDDADDAILRQRARTLRARVVQNRLLVHRAVDVVRAEGERYLSDGDGQHDPICLDVREIVEHEARNRHRPEVVPHRGLRDAALRGERRVLRQKREADEGLEATRLVLQRAQREQMVDALGERLDMPVEHRGVRLDAEFMRRARSVEPLLRRRLVRTQLFADAVGENLSAAACDGVESRRLEPFQHLAHGKPRDLGKMRDLDAREALEVELGESFVQCTKPREVVIERPRGMQS